MYCSNCGAKVESDALHCPYCGKSFMHASKDLMTEKDLKIEALERKLLSLEQQLGKKQKEKNWQTRKRIGWNLNY